MDSTFSRILAWAAQTAQSTPAAGSSTPGTPAAGPDWQSMLPMIAIIVVFFYFLILRPQKQEQRRREQMLNQLAKGDEVLTSGGIFGTVESIDAAKGAVTVTIAPKVTIKVSRSSITTISKKKGKSSEAE